MSMLKNKNRSVANLNVVMVEPEIPQNTGNIARTCAAVAARLHLIKPLGFFIRDRHLKRAGLDYWHDVEVVYHDCLADFFEAYKKCRFAFFSRKAKKTHDTGRLPKNKELFLVFDKESTGLSDGLLAANLDHCFRLPMKAGVRSLNLASAASVVIYEVLRKQGFPGLK